MDAVAAALVEMRKSNDLFLNIVHPKPVPSCVIFQAFAESLAAPLVSYPEWLAALEASKQDDVTAAIAAAIKNPALVLLQFYRSLHRPPPASDPDSVEAFGVPLSSADHALAAAPFLRDPPQLTPADAISWIEHWQETGFLDPE